MVGAGERGDEGCEFEMLTNPWSEFGDHLKQGIGRLPVSSRGSNRQRLFYCIVGELGSPISTGAVQVDLMSGCIESVWTGRERFQVFQRILLRGLRQKSDMQLR